MDFLLRRDKDDPKTDWVSGTLFRATPDYQPGWPPILAEYCKTLEIVGPPPGFYEIQLIAGQVRVLITDPPDFPATTFHSGIDSVQAGTGILVGKQVSDGQMEDSHTVMARLKEDVTIASNNERKMFIKIEDWTAPAEPSE